MTGADDANLPYYIAISCMVALMLVSILIAVGVIKNKEKFTQVVGGLVVLVGGGGLIYVIGYTVAYVAMSTNYTDNEIPGFSECVAKEKVDDAPAPAPAKEGEAKKLSPKEEVRASCCIYLQGEYTASEDPSEEGHCVYTEPPWSLEGEAVAAEDEAPAEEDKPKAPAPKEEPPAEEKADGDKPEGEKPEGEKPAEEAPAN